MIEIGDERIDPTDRTALVANPQIERLFADALHAVNQRLASFEQLKKFRLVDHVDVAVGLAHGRLSRAGVSHSA